MGGFSLYKSTLLTINQNNNFYYPSIFSGVLILTGIYLLYMKKTKVLFCIVIVHLFLTLVTFMVVRTGLVNSLSPGISFMTIFISLTYLLILVITLPIGLVLYGFKNIINR